MKSRVSGRTMEGARVGRRGKADGDRKVPASEMRFRRLFETSKDGILILESDTRRIVEANAFLGELLGIPASELIGKEVSDIGLFTPEQADPIWQQLVRAGCVRLEQALPASARSSSREVELVCHIYDEDGRKLIQCNVRDIAERKASERRLREALLQVAAAKEELEARFQERTADLQQRNAELEAFSYSLSHDLRAPIRAIVSFTQIAVEDFGSQLGPGGIQLLERCIAAAQRLDRLIQDVLAFSKTSRKRVARSTLDVDSLLKDILQERAEWNLPRAQVTIESPLLKVCGDPASLTQCLTNLLDNAVKFVRPGVIPQVRVYTQPVGSRVRLCVSDNGIGIPPSAQSRVFELFQRAHNGYEGHGVGLAIVRRAAERMGGHVGLSSEAGKGSTFWVELPGEP